MFHVPNDCRKTSGEYSSTDLSGNNGVFYIPLKDKLGKVRHWFQCVANDAKEWKPVVGYEGLYMVSNYGEVRSLERVVKTPRATRIAPATNLKGFTTDTGYHTVTLNGKLVPLRSYIHKLVASAFIKNPHNYPQVNHIDGNKSNNFVDNLEWCTCQYNIQHAIRNGLMKGYTYDEVKIISELIDSGVSLTEISKKVNRKFMSIIDFKRRTKNLTSDPPTKYSGKDILESVSVCLISHDKKNIINRFPTYEEMKQIKDIFWDDSDTCMQIIGKRNITNDSFILRLIRKPSSEIKCPLSTLEEIK